MSITELDTNEAVLRELGSRLRRTRLDRNLSQESWLRRPGSAGRPCSG